MCRASFFKIKNNLPVRSKALHISNKLYETGVTDLVFNNFFLSHHAIISLAPSKKMNYPKIEHKLRKQEDIEHGKD